MTPESETQRIVIEGGPLDGCRIEAEYPSGPPKPNVILNVIAAAYRFDRFENGSEVWTPREAASDAE